MADKSRRRQDIRWQLLALYLLFVVPIFIVGLVFYYDASQRLRADVSEADLNLARAIALETDELLLKAKEAVETFSHRQAVITVDRAGMEQEFAAGAAARQDINLFYRLSDTGIMLYHYPSAPGSTIGEDFSFRDYFQQARATGEHVFSKGRISPTTGRPVVSSVMPVFAQGEFDGVVAINLELQRLTETVQRIGLDRTEDGGVTILIVDRTGQEIAHSQPDHPLLRDVVADFPGVEEVLAGMEGSLTFTDAADVEWLNTFTPVPSANWGVIVHRPTRFAFASLNSFQRGLMLAFAIFTLGALMFWVVLSRRVIIPLEKLTRYGEIVGEERLEPEQDRALILPIAQRPDQIGQLTQTLLQAEDNIRRRFLELTTLNKTSAAVVSALDTQQVIDTILDEVQHLFAVHRFALLVVDDSTKQLEVLASRGLGPNYPTTIDLREAPADLPAVRAITGNQPVQVPDIDGASNETGAGGYRSGLIIPLNAPHIPQAALAIYRDDLHRFSKQEIDLATSFANHAAIALEHATLFSLTDAELQKQVRSLSALNRVGRTVSQSLLLDEVLNNAMAAVFEVMPADACWIYLQRETEGFLRFRAQRGLPDALLEQVRDRQIEQGQGVIGQVASTGQTLLLDKAQLQPEQWPDDPMVKAAVWQSMVVAPLLAKETVIGALGLGTYSFDQTFTGTEVELVKAIGDQIAIAVVNARLYRRSRELAILEERNRVAREIHDTLAQGFTGILLQLQAAERLSLKYPEQSLQSLQEARDLARESLQEARRSVLNLRPTVLENLPLDQAIAQQVGRFQGETGIEANFVLEGYPNPTNPEVEKNLYRIAQEALTNVSRHAQAQSVTVTLAFNGKDVSLTISDDGRGLDGWGNNYQTLQKLARKNNGHFGLLGIKERVHLLGGRVTFDKSASGGTKIEVVIPE